MKTFFQMVCLFLAFGLISDVHADNVVAYADPPVWMTDAYPDTIECHIVEGTMRIIACNDDKKVPWKTEVLLIDTETQRMWRHQETNLLSGVCGGGSYCMTDMHGEAYGRVANWPNRISAVVLRGYYLYADGPDPDNSRIMAYRRGTGPLADEYPQYLVYNQTTPTTQQTSSQQVTYDLWCSPREDLCAFTDADGVQYRLDREYLPNYIPLAEDTSNCFREVCYDESHDGVVGLNPEYYPRW